jgi:hypothetical protein
MIVRMALVPALMLLLGKRNWALPGWLDRILPHLNVEGSVTEPAAAEEHHHPHAQLHPPLRPQGAES